MVFLGINLYIFKTFPYLEYLNFCLESLITFAVFTYEP